MPIGKTKRRRPSTTKPLLNPIKNSFDAGAQAYAIQGLSLAVQRFPNAINFVGHVMCLVVEKVNTLL